MLIYFIHFCISIPFHYFYHFQILLSIILIDTSYPDMCCPENILLLINIMYFLFFLSVYYLSLFRMKIWSDKSQDIRTTQSSKNHLAMGSLSVELGLALAAQILTQSLCNFSGCVYMSFPSLSLTKKESQQICSYRIEVVNLISHIRQYHNIIMQQLLHNYSLLSIFHALKYRFMLGAKMAV